MSKRSVFVSKNSYPYFEEVHVIIDWFGGFALSKEKVPDRSSSELPCSVTRAKSVGNILRALDVTWSKAQRHEFEQENVQRLFLCR